MYDIELQLAVDSHPDIPTQKQFEHWVHTTLIGRRENAEMTIRLVDTAESATLNEQFRQRSGPTNILSFPIETDMILPVPLLGDLVICVPLVLAEAEQQAKSVEFHWAHLVVHGVLHLLGYDHQTDAMAQTMETLEIAILAELGYPNPYGDSESYD